MSQRLAYIIIFMFASPALSLYQGLMSRSDEIKRWTLILFITIFGSVIRINEGQDGFRHQQRVEEHYTDLSFQEFAVELYRIVTLQGNETTEEEPYMHVLSYFTGAVIGLPGLFFTFVAFIYAYFFAGSIFRLFRVFPKFRYSQLFFGFGMVFLLWKGLEGINTVRTWTGMWVLFYACLSYYQTGRKKYLLLMFVPPLIHIGYAVMALPAWGVLVLGTRKWLYAGLFFLSFGATIVNPGNAVSLIQTTAVGQTKVNEYYVDKEITAEETLQSVQGSKWYLKLFRIGAQNWAMAGVAGILILFGAYFRHMTPLESKLFSIGLLTKVLANSTWFLYTVADRSEVVAGTFILAALLLMWQRGYFQQRRKIMGYQKMALTVALLLFAPFVIYRIADLIYFISVFVLVTPFVPWFNEELNLSIRQTIGKFLGV